MTAIDRVAGPVEQPVDKDLKPGALVGLACFLCCRLVRPGSGFFKGRTLTRSTETLVPDPGK